jgi:hypothetical protein
MKTAKRKYGPFPKGADPLVQASDTAKPYPLDKYMSSSVLAAL